MAPYVYPIYFHYQPIYYMALNHLLMDVIHFIGPIYQFFIVIQSNTGGNCSILAFDFSTGGNTGRSTLLFSFAFSHSLFAISLFHDFRLSRHKLSQ